MKFDGDRNTLHYRNKNAIEPRKRTMGWQSDVDRKVNIMNAPPYYINNEDLKVDKVDGDFFTQR